MLNLSTAPMCNMGLSQNSQFVLTTTVSWKIFGLLKVENFF